MPRKLGQHFLASESILAQIAAAGSVNPGRIVEIGAGRGALTRHLLPLCEELHALEIDARLVASLAAKFAAEPKLHIHQADVLPLIWLSGVLPSLPVTCRIT